MLSAEERAQRARVHEVLDGELRAATLGEAEQRELLAYERAAAEALAGLPRSAPPELAAGVMARVRATAGARAGAEARADAREAQSDDRVRARLRRALEDARAGAPGVPSGDDGSWSDSEAAGYGDWSAAARAVLGRAGRRVARIASWIWTPRPVALTLRPAWGLAALVAVAVLARAPVWRADAPRPQAQARVFVHFRLDAPGAHDVALAGDFTNWRPAYALHEGAPGVWSVAVPLTPGVHDYVFVVDGRRWVVDPLAPPVSDGFGGSNSRVAVLPPVLDRES